MKYKSITLYKSTFCPDCILADRFFKQNHIKVNQTINIDEDVKAASIVLKLNNGYRSVPTIVLEGENNFTTVLVEPSWFELEEIFK